MSKMSECAVTLSANRNRRDPASLCSPGAQPCLRHALGASHSPNPHLGLCFWGSSTQDRHLNQQGPAGEQRELRSMLEQPGREGSLGEKGILG